MRTLQVATIGVYVQAFFLHRLKAISGSWLVILPNAAIFLLAYIAIILAVGDFILFQSTGHWPIVDIFQHGGTSGTSGSMVYGPCSSFSREILLLKFFSSVAIHFACTFGKIKQQRMNMDVTKINIPSKSEIFS